jgi:hypothetical protein
LDVVICESWPITAKVALGLLRLVVDFVPDVGGILGFASMKMDTGRTKLRG